jgi:hypothetical protein
MLSFITRIISILKTECGLGCQVHHRAACLMISYAMGLPMIHDTRKGKEDGWAYSKSWNDVLKPLGIPCAPGNFTYTWSWQQTNAYCKKLQFQRFFS